MQQKANFAFNSEFAIETLNMLWEA